MVWSENQWTKVINPWEHFIHIVHTYGSYALKREENMSAEGYMKSHKPRQFVLILWNIFFFQNKLVLLYYWGIFRSDLHKMLACVWWRPLAQTVQKKMMYLWNTEFQAGCGFGSQAFLCGVCMLFLWLRGFCRERGIGPTSQLVRQTAHRSDLPSPNPNPNSNGRFPVLSVFYYFL